MFTLDESKPGYPLMLHDEPIYFNDKIIGRTTSCNYSFNSNKNLAYGYVASNYSTQTLKDKSIFIEIEKKKFAATVLTTPLNNKNLKNT